MSQNQPHIMDTKTGNYAWCACGLSKKRPFCDGSHSSTSVRPVLVNIPEDQVVAWCGCGASNKKPFCDGSHSKVR